MTIHWAFQAGLIDVWFDKILRNEEDCDLSDKDWVLLRDVDANKSKSVNDSANFSHRLVVMNLHAPFLFFGLGLLVAS